jgi:very-short-patch-repair endonuclease
MSRFDKFLKIREAYAYLLPLWMAEYEKTGDMRNDPYFIDWEFSPIERNVWGDIRTLGLPFFPQVPVLNYFIDFGCPFLKIGIECDGKAWHDSELDRARDMRLAAHGWMIFRIEGHECVRVVEPWDEYGEDRAALVEKYFMSTSEGIVSAIKRKYFGGELSAKYSFLIEATLFEHRSTPETYPEFRPMTKKTMPRKIGEMMQEHIELLMERAKFARA